MNKLPSPHMLAGNIVEGELLQTNTNSLPTDHPGAVASFLISSCSQQLSTIPQWWAGLVR